MLIPEPVDYTSQLAGLDQEIGQKMDATAYLREERGAWENSPTD
ncbi:MAG TPA: hypothetical protein VJ436_13010 [Anaerolineales bacterium]|nr:hypothetical protein [Anaerolineales bacterium]